MSHPSPIARSPPDRSVGIGRSIVARLVGRGYEVVSADVSPVPSADGGAGADGVEHLELDLATEAGVRAAVHFAPVAAVLILTLPIYLQSGPEKIALLGRLAAGDPPTLLAVLEPLKYVSGLAYSAATIAYLRGHRRG